MEVRRKDREQIKQDLLKMRLKYAKLQKKLTKAEKAVRAKEHVKKTLDKQSCEKGTLHLMTSGEDSKKHAAVKVSHNNSSNKGNRRRSVSFKLERDLNERKVTESSGYNVDDNQALKPEDSGQSCNASDLDSMTKSKDSEGRKDISQPTSSLPDVQASQILSKSFQKLQFKNKSTQSRLELEEGFSQKHCSKSRRDSETEKKHQKSVSQRYSKSPVESADDLHPPHLPENRSIELCNLKENEKIFETPNSKSEGIVPQISSQSNQSSDSYTGSKNQKVCSTKISGDETDSSLQKTVIIGGSNSSLMKPYEVSVFKSSQTSTAGRRTVKSTSSKDDSMNSLEKAAVSSESIQEYSDSADKADTILSDPIILKKQSDVGKGETEQKLLEGRRKPIPASRGGAEKVRDSHSSGVVVKRRRSRRSKQLRAEDINMKALSQQNEEHTLIEGLMFPVEYYVRETRSMSRGSLTTPHTSHRVPAPESRNENAPLTSAKLPSVNDDSKEPEPVIFNTCSFQSEHVAGSHSKIKKLEETCLGSESLLNSQCTQSQLAIGEMPPLGISPVKERLISSPGDNVRTALFSSQLSTSATLKERSVPGDDSEDCRGEIDHGPETSKGEKYITPINKSLLLGTGEGEHLIPDSSTQNKNLENSVEIKVCESAVSTCKNNSICSGPEGQTKRWLKHKVSKDPVDDSLTDGETWKGLAWCGCLEVQSMTLIGKSPDQEQMVVSSQEMEWSGLSACHTENHDCVFVNTALSLVLWAKQIGGPWEIISSWETKKDEEFVEMKSLPFSDEMVAAVILLDYEENIYARVIKYNLETHEEDVIHVDLPSTLTMSHPKVVCHRRSVVLINKCGDTINCYHGLQLEEDLCKSISGDLLSASGRSILDVVPLCGLSDVFLIFYNDSMTLWSVSADTYLGNFDQTDWDIRRCFWCKVERGLMFMVVLLKKSPLSSSQSAGLALMVLNPSTGKMLPLHQYRMSCMHQEAGIKEVHVSFPFLVALFHDGSILWWDLMSSQCLTEVAAGHQTPYTISVTNSHLITLGTCIQVYDVLR